MIEFLVHIAGHALTSAKQSANCRNHKTYHSAVCEYFFYNTEKRITGLCVFGVLLILMNSLFRQLEHQRIENNRRKAAHNRHEEVPAAVRIALLVPDDKIDNRDIQKADAHAAESSGTRKLCALDRIIGDHRSHGSIRH